MNAVIEYLNTVLLDRTYDSARAAMETRLCPALQATKTSVLSRLIGNYGGQLCKVASDPSIWDRNSLVRQSASLFGFLWQVSPRPLMQGH